MKIFTKRDTYSKEVLTVELAGSYKGTTEQDMMDAMAKFNANYKHVCYEAIDIEDEKISEIFKFLMGDEKYRVAKTIQDLIDKMEEIQETLNEIENDTDSARSFLTKMKKELLIVKEK